MDLVQLSLRQFPAGSPFPDLMALAFAVATLHYQVSPLERASRPPSKYVATALPCFHARAKTLCVPLIWHGGHGSPPPSKYVASALSCFRARAKTLCVPLIGHGGQNSPRPAWATLAGGAGLPSLRFSFASPARGVLSQIASGHISPGA